MASSAAQHALLRSGLVSMDATQMSLDTTP
jgi:hypothetical protein